ncbi:MAG TPA: pilin [Candidatus Nitrosocosmicus sp.]|nr:pilin [Candidatus Nitrosocosmicus sp.]
MNKLAQNLTIGGEEIKGRVVGINNIGDLVNKFTDFLYPIAGVLLFLYLAWGGFDFLLSRGDKERVEKGKAKITAAIIGFILLVLSYVLVRIIASVFGLTSAESIF